MIGAHDRVSYGGDTRKRPEAYRTALSYSSNSGNATSFMFFGTVKISVWARSTA